MEREIEVTGTKSDRAKLLLTHLAALTQTLTPIPTPTLPTAVAVTDTDTDTLAQWREQRGDLEKEIKYVADTIADRTGRPRP